MWWLGAPDDYAFGHGAAAYAWLIANEQDC